MSLTAIPRCGVHPLDLDSQQQRGAVVGLVARRRTNPGGARSCPPAVPEVAQTAPRAGALRRYRKTCGPRGFAGGGALRQYQGASNVNL